MLIYIKAILSSGLTSELWMLIIEIRGHAIVGRTVKNGFSDLTKVQIGWDQFGKDVMNDHQGKALKEGCCEKERAQTGVFLIEETNTKGDLARVTAKS